MGSILIEGGNVLTMGRDRRSIRSGAVYVEDGVVAEIGETSFLRKKCRPEREISAENHIVLPGFVNSHVHMTHSLIRGLCQDLTLEDCLTRVIWPAQAAMDGEDAVAASELCMLEMLLSGTTTFVEAGLHTRFRLDRIAESVQKIGVRGILSKTIMDTPSGTTNVGALNPAMIEDAEACFRETTFLRKKWSKPGTTVGIWLAPRALGAVSKELFKDIVQYSRENDTGITMHLRESRTEVEFTKREYGVTPVQFAREVGLLGPRTLFAHMLDPDPEDITALLRSSTAIAHCPTSNASLASGYCPVSLLREAGVRVALGCDGASHNFTYDMFDEIRMASMLHKAVTLNPTTLPAIDVLEMATSGEAVGLHSLGSIEVGKQADIITVNLKAHSLPAPDAASTLVYSSTGVDVDNVIVGGSVLVEGGKVLTCDVEGVLKRARHASQRVLERSGLRPA